MLVSMGRIVLGKYIRISYDDAGLILWAPYFDGCMRYKKTPRPNPYKTLS